MARPWICESCGTATNRDHCPTCLRARPFPEPPRAPGSYVGIIFGPGDGWGNSENPPKINWPVVAGALWIIGMFLIPVIMLGC